MQSMFNNKGAINTEAVIINNSLAIDVYDLNRIIQAEVKKVETSAGLRIIKGYFMGDYDMESDKYVGTFRSVTGNYYLFGNDGLYEVWDANPKAIHDIRMVSA